MSEDPGSSDPAFSSAWFAVARAIACCRRLLHRWADGLRKKVRLKDVSWPWLLAIRVGIYVGLAVVAGATHEVPGWAKTALIASLLGASFVVGELFPLSRKFVTRAEAAGAQGGEAEGGDTVASDKTLGRGFTIFVGALIMIAGLIGAGLAGGLKLGNDASVIKSAWVFASYAAIVLGFGFVGRSVRTLQGSWLHRLAMGALVIAFAGFGWAMLQLRHGRITLLPVASLALLPSAIGLCTEWMVPTPLPSTQVRFRRPLTWLLGGLGTMVLVGIALGLFTNIAWMALAWGFGALFVLLLAVSIRGDSDVVVIVLALALSWASGPGSPPASATSVLKVVPNQKGPTSYFAALGDSYISGEGATAFYEGTNVLGQNQCRRAHSAYSPLLAANAAKEAKDPKTADGLRKTVPPKLVFLACSGAVAAELEDRVQEPGDPIGGPSELQADGTYRPGQPQLVQLAAQMRRIGNPPKFVLLGIGGNDANFGKIVQTCLLPGDCSALAKIWLRPFDSTAREALAGRLDRAFEQVRDTVGAGVPVVVVPYPNPLKDLDTKGNCADSLVTDNEVRFLHGFTNMLDSTLAAAAVRAGFYVADEVAVAWDAANIQLCDHPKAPLKLGVNWLAFNPTGGLPEKVINPRTWTHNSMHPTATGHQVVEKTLATWLAAHPFTVPAAGSSLTAVKAASMDPWRLNLPSYCSPADKPAASSETVDACVSHWQLVQVGRAILGRELLFIVLFGFGCWFFICALIAAVRCRTAD